MNKCHGKNAQLQIDRFIMNNCKIANELRKYRILLDA